MLLKYLLVKENDFPSMNMFIYRANEKGQKRREVYKFWKKHTRMYDAKDRLIKNRPQITNLKFYIEIYYIIYH